MAHVCSDMARRNKEITRLHRHVRVALERSGLAPGKLLVVAVSGGPDSLAMLYALHHLRDSLGLRLHGAHLDHGLRGDASNADARFVAETFRRLDIPFTLEEADVLTFRQEHRLSLEEAAREARYAFLSRVAAEQGADATALGHTANDQAETVLMHIIRGTGLAGLRGMEAVTRRTCGGREIILVRPLLGVSRRETADYCRALKLEPRQDESNLSLELTRNRVRMELLPLLEQHNPAILDALVRLSSTAAQDMAYIEAQVDKVWHEIAREDGDGVALSRDAFSRLAPALQSHLLRRAVLAVKGNLDDLEHNHVEDMARLMVGAAGKSLDLSGGLRFTVSYTEALLRPKERETGALPPLDGQHRLQIPGETLLPGWRVVATILDQHGQLIESPDFNREAPQSDSLSRVACLDYDSLEGELWVRSRVPGDRFQPLGMSQDKKLQDFMVDSKIPRSWRDRVQLVVSPRGIAWVVGWRIAEWAKVAEKTAHAVELRFQRR